MQKQACYAHHNGGTRPNQPDPRGLLFHGAPKEAAHTEKACYQQHEKNNVNHNPPASLNTLRGLKYI
jgi:hypothetical protein